MFFGKLKGFQPLIHSSAIGLALRGFSPNPVSSGINLAMRTVVNLPSQEVPLIEKKAKTKEKKPRFTFSLSRKSATKRLNKRK